VARVALGTAPIHHAQGILGEFKPGRVRIALGVGRLDGRRRQLGRNGVGLQPVSRFQASRVKPRGQRVLPNAYGVKSSTATSSAAKVNVVAPAVQVTAVAVTSSRLAVGAGASRRIATVRDCELSLKTVR